MSPAIPAISAETGAADIPAPSHSSVKHARSRRLRSPCLGFPVVQRSPFPADRFASGHGQQTPPTHFLVRMKIHRTNVSRFGPLHADSPSAFLEYPREAPRRLLARSCFGLDEQSPISLPAGPRESSNRFEFCP